MGFVKTLQEIMANTSPTAAFYGAKMLTVFWETKPELELWSTVSLARYQQIVKLASVD
jgi:hypothetical protein